MQQKYLLFAIVVGALLAGSFARGQGNPRGAQISLAARTALSPPLRDIAATPAPARASREIRNIVKFVPPGRAATAAQAPDSMRQLSAETTSSIAATPLPSLSFDGTSDDDNALFAGGRVVPPDTEGDVGPNHYVQMNNLVFQIFDKSGISQVGPLANNTLWANLGGACAANNDGDPIVLYDQQADRWMLSQFAIDADGHQCIAVSQTSDPTMSYYLYDFVVSPGAFNDYPKLGVWPDGYYLSANEFAGPFRSAIAVAFERDQMLAGSPGARMVKFDAASTPAETYFSLQPSHLEGNTLPPTGSPNLFLMSFDDETWGVGGGPDGYRLWEFSVNWTTDTFSFTQIPNAASAEFDANLCNFNPCVNQPPGGELLDTLSQFTMFRASYRNLGSAETIVGTHTVDVGLNTAGVRWFELRKTGPSNWSVSQAGSFAPNDGNHRWMGSAAMDKDGNIAVAYSVSGSGTFPSIRYNTRAPGDAAGELPGGEVECHVGGGSQSSSFNRWGDYSTISVDPVDDCTFWLTNEYYAANGSFDFNTRICSFVVPSCAGLPSPPATPSDLTATAGSSGKGRTRSVFVDLAWTDNSSNEADFPIERAILSGKGKNKQCGGYLMIGTAPADMPSFRDSSVERRTEYCYRVRARNATGSSPPSNVATAKTN